MVDAGYQSNDYKGNKVSGINHNGSGTSQIDIIVSQDLGNGLKANYFSETDINLTQAKGNTGFASSAKNATASGAGSWMNSETKVGLSGGFGAINAGVVNANQLTAVGIAQPFGTAIGGGYGSILKAVANTTAGADSVVRFDNSVRYDTPVFSGFSGSAYWAGKQTKAADTQVFSTTLGAYDRAGVNEYALKYSQGPLNAIYVQQTVDNKDVTNAGAATLFNTPVAGTAGTAEVTMKSLAANYTYGAFTFGAINQTNKDDKATAAVDTKANLFSVKYVNGAHTVGATSGSLTNNVLGKKSTFTGYGYDYALSKTAALYARAETLRDDGVTVDAVTGYTETTTKRTRQALGLRIAF